MAVPSITLQEKLNSLPTSPGFRVRCGIIRDMSLRNDAKMDKTALTVASLHDPSDENEYWRRQTPKARWEALELMRQVVYGYDPSTERLQRLLTIARRESG